jgi:hypothetical protein
MSLRIQRGPVRAAFTKVYGEIKAELEKAEVNRESVELLFRRLQDRRAKLQELDTTIEAELRAGETTEDDYAAEYNSSMEYSDKFAELEMRVARALEKKTQDDDFETASSSGSNTRHQTKYRLPKLEFKKFGGDPKEWLGFWSQFRSIAEDEDMATTDKFQYLVQATKEKSTARAVVESFPPTAENFPKVIDYMKSRFGNEDILVEVYVRDLLRLVLEKKTGPQTNSVVILYDQLETQLRALESLGVTSDKYVAMLFPLVESALPEETLRAWERVRTVSVTANEERLKKLMSFLRAEVDSETRIKLAKTGFGTDEKTETSKPRGGRRYDEDVPTAVDLYSGNGKRDCIFCDKNHESSECYSAAKMPLEDKTKCVKDKKACYHCLRIGHFSKNCRGKPKCQLCEQFHFVVMCPDLPKHKKAPVETTDSTSNLANNTATGVLLQTLLVNLKNGAVTRSVRALIDTGSQHSYLTEKAAEVMGFSSCGEVKMAHSLFGGQETRLKVHRVFEVTLAGMDGKYHVKRRLMDQPKICGSVSSVPEGPWLRELTDAGIEVTDVDQNHRDIHLLIGADLAGELFTGKMYPTRSGPVAMETRLGWIVMGKCRNVKSSADSSLLATALHSSSVDLQDLWRLDVLGITDPVETKNKDELMESAKKFFVESTRMNEDDRYEVSLPWLEGHPPVSTNRELAEKRLRSAYKKLQATESVDPYQRVFEWKDLGVIERVEEKDSVSKVSYLPHRPVFKPNSTTTPLRPVFDASAKSGGLPSLNDCLEEGTILIELVPDVLTRFRLKRYGVTSDIKKAFLMISVRKEDRDLLRFLWWENGSLQTYKHCRVVFGLSSSPFLLAATINLLKKIDWKKIESIGTTERLKWKFNPPSAPWWGGWWERVVGMVKVLLRRILGRASLLYEELSTVMCDVECVINSRPLTHLSGSPKDLVALSPNLFLIDDKPYGVPDLDAVDSKSLNRRLQYQQQLKNDLRKRFRDEYLGLLVHRNTKKVSEHRIRVGDVVLVGCDNKKRLEWPLARVTELIPGRDGVERVAKLKTAKGEITRPIQRLYPLEIASGSGEDVERLVERLNGMKEKKDVHCARANNNTPHDSLPYVIRYGRISRLPHKFME